MNLSFNVKLIIDDHTKDKDNFLFKDVCLNDNITIADLMNMYKESEDNEIYVICRGDLVRSDANLGELGICEGSCFKIVIKKRLISHDILYNENSVKEIVKKHKQMMKTRFKQVINESLERGLDDVIDKEYGLEKDLLAYSITFDYRLLRTLLGSTDNVSRVLQRCPILIPAAQKMINIIQEKLKKVAVQHMALPEQDPRYFSLGEVEQSDDDSSDDGGEDQPSSSSQSRSGAAAVSRSQLREAISSVPGSAAPRGAVSMSQLRSAIRTAMVSAVPEPMEVDVAPVNNDLELKVDQLCAMGFPDRVANKAALEAVAGNLEVAIELLLS